MKNFRFMKVHEPAYRQGRQASVAAVGASLPCRQAGNKKFQSFTEEIYIKKINSKQKQKK
ncbi:MAG: hypothetical protein V1904_02940 [Bacteroidota bacterium]